jgi:hypothetical protein
MVDQANSPTRTTWRWASSMRVRSASQRDSGHCSGYQAVPRRIGVGGGGDAGLCAERDRALMTKTTAEDRMRLRTLWNGSKFVPRWRTGALSAYVGQAGYGHTECSDR